jgi:hypothetical protein
MIKKSVILLLSLLLSACAYPILANTNATNSQVSAQDTTSQILTTSQTSTLIPTLPTATFTQTPTLIHLDPTPTMTPEGISIETITPVLVSTEAVATNLISTQNMTETPPIQTVPKNSLFTTIAISGGRIFWGVCEPSYVKVTAHIDDLSKVYIVTIWLRLANKKTGDTTDWGGGAIMNDDGKGNFAYSLTAKSFSHYREYSDAWGQYQLVASDRNLDRIGASAQYLNNLSVAPCP